MKNPFLPWWYTARCLILSLCLHGASVAQEQVQLPDFGDPSGAVFSKADEIALGEAFMREISAVLDIVNDPEVQNYIQTVGYALSSHTDTGGIGFTFFVVGDKGINAFAGPGGYVGINAGVFLASDSESEFASVVAHEIAHVSQKHIARAIANASRTNLPALAGLLAAVIIGIQNVDAGRATAAAVIGAQVQNSIDFTRANEIDADNVGIQLLARAEFDPHAMPIFFEKLQNSSRYYRQPPEFLSTHPVTSSRIADARARADRYPYKQYTDSINFHLVKAKLRVMTEPDAAKSLAFFDGALESGEHANLAATHYGRALALARLNRPDEARDVLQKLVTADSERLSFRTTLAEMELAAGNFGTAFDIYADADHLFPDNELLVRSYAASLIQVKRGADALRLLDDYRRYHRMDAATFRLAAEAHALVGSRIASLLALAEHFYLSGQLDSAIHQLRLATKLPDDDYYLSSRAVARLEEFEQEHARRTRR